MSFIGRATGLCSPSTLMTVKVHTLSTAKVVPTVHMLLHRIMLRYCTGSFVGVGLMNAVNSKYDSEKSCTLLHWEPFIGDGMFLCTSTS